jgi:hypothetical protein
MKKDVFSKKFLQKWFEWVGIFLFVHPYKKQFEFQNWKNRWNKG